MRTRAWAAAAVLVLGAGGVLAYDVRSSDDARQPTTPATTRLVGVDDLAVEIPVDDLRAGHGCEVDSWGLAAATDATLLLGAGPVPEGRTPGVFGGPDPQRLSCAFTGDHGDEAAVRFHRGEPPAADGSAAVGERVRAAPVECDDVRCSTTAWVEGSSDWLAVAAAGGRSAATAEVERIVASVRHLEDAVGLPPADWVEPPEGGRATTYGAWLRARGPEVAVDVHSLPVSTPPVARPGVGSVVARGDTVILFEHAPARTPADRVDLLVRVLPATDPDEHPEPATAMAEIDGSSAVVFVPRARTVPALDVRLGTTVRLQRGDVLSVTAAPEPWSGETVAETLSGEVDGDALEERERTTYRDRVELAWEVRGEGRTTLRLTVDQDGERVEVGEIRVEVVDP
ncbi:hypothetical protein INN71_04215 [Nocardioides sp. ChNu-153]|uniref:hypothetical protein n=1 Tax=unclassified Nocardioides TaxID=2615069 RepID=UPI00240616AE|nr:MULTISPECIES: hypothetical protein [unclassified Nocardioides]MDF9715429.1 hypothetical protein [Nocardioides sp. ChNu-99]MDN7120592.1 hypothetical protein [Nocardioides sp. ChNu-153]